MFKVNNKDSRTSNFEHISHIAVVFLLLTLDMSLPAGLRNQINVLLSKVSHEVSYFSITVKG